MTNYLIVIEKAKSNYSAYSPDLDGCVAIGKTREETIRNMKEAIEFHLAGLREDGIAIPKGKTSAEYIAV